MKVLIPILIGLMMAGCGKKQTTNTNEGNNTPKADPKEVGKETPSKRDDNNSTTSKPVSDTNATKLTPEEQKVVGEYEFKNDGGSGGLILLENGNSEAYYNGKKVEEEGKWGISKEGELHVGDRAGIQLLFFRINNDSSITAIARMSKDGKREEAPKEYQSTFKKIK